MIARSICEGNKQITVLITGGTGFLGQHLARDLLSNDQQVRMMGRDFTRSQTLLAEGAQPVVADLRDLHAVLAACEGADTVIHAGALSAPWGKPADFHAINVGGTRAIVAGCHQHAVRRLVYVSSPSVVFDGGDQRELTEAAPYPDRFASTYSYTKKLGEDIVRASGLEYVIIRPKAIFGPGDTTLLPRLIDAARQRRLPQIGDGQNLVDLTYVENVVYALRLALTAPNAAGKTYHITNGEHILLWDVIRSVLHRLGIPNQLRHVPLAVATLAAGAMEFRAALTGQEPRLTRYSVAILGRTQTYDITAARRDLDYTPRITVAAGIEQTLTSLRN